MRTGLGFDAHRFDDSQAPLRLGGVVVDEGRGLAATSDGDVLAHAITDALLGAAALGDMGTHFPSEDAQWAGADSLEMLKQAVAALAAVGLRPSSVDATVVAQSVRVGPYRSQMQAALAMAIGLDAAMVSVKATTTDGMGAIGADQGVAALAVATVEQA